MQDTETDIPPILESARALQQAGQLAQAETAYHEALLRAPDFPPLLLELGAFYYKQQAFAQAAAYLERVAGRLGPHDLSVHIYLSSAYQHLRDHAAAQRHLEACLAIQPDFPAVQTALIDLELNLDRLHTPGIAPSEWLFRRPAPSFQRLQIEVTTWCNLQCAGCPRTIALENGQWANYHMPLQQFMTIVDTLPGSEVLCLQGVGESSLHPEFPEMVAYAHASGKYRDMTLNTNLLARGAEYYGALRDAGLNHLSVSVDSFDPAIAEACRKGTVVEKLQARLKEAHAIFAPAPIAVTIVASKRNLHDVPNTLRILDDIGPFNVEIQSLIVYDADKGDEGNAAVGLDEKDVQTLLDYMRGPYSNLNILSMLDNPSSRSQRCSRPFLSPYVTAQGYLTPCCTIEDPALLGHVRIDGRPFAEIWQTPSLQRWIRNYVEKAPDICKGCCFFNG